jgi:hypothetical protein
MGTFLHDVANTSAPIPASQANSATSATQAPPVTTSTASSVSSKNYNPPRNEYTAIGGLPATLPGPLTLGQRMKEGGSAAYEGLKITFKGIHDCSDMFLPLKAVSGVILTIITVIDVRESTGMCSTCRRVINISFCLPESVSK